MKALSRRDLLFGSLGKRKPSASQASSKVIVGRVANFPLGQKTKLPQFQLSIEALPEGLRAQSSQNENQYFALQTNQFGEIIVNRCENWPAEVLFSVLTNEPLDLGPSSKKEDS